MEFLVEFGPLMVVGLIILAYGIYMFISATKMTPEQRLNAFYDVIRRLVEQANIYMEGQEGQDKLRVVYAQFAKQYPALAAMVTFEQFADFVEKVLADIKLEQMKNDIKENK